MGGQTEEAVSSSSQQDHKENFWHNLRILTNFLLEGDQAQGMSSTERRVHMRKGWDDHDRWRYIITALSASPYIIPWNQVPSRPGKHPWGFRTLWHPKLLWASSYSCWRPLCIGSFLSHEEKPSEGWRSSAPLVPCHSSIFFFFSFGRSRERRRIMPLKCENLMTHALLQWKQLLKSQRHLPSS